MRRKGQAINIDWSVGLGLFLVTALTAVLFITNTNIAGNDIDDVRSKAFDIQDNLESETAVSGGEIPLVIRGPENISNIPVDRQYSFSSDAYPSSGGGEIPVEMDIPGNRIVTVTDGGNLTNSLVYFEESVSNISYSNDIDTGNWINNSKISVKPGSPGLTSLQVNSQELLNPDADLGSGTYSINENDLYAETLSGDLGVYNGSTELILDDRSSNLTFDLNNLTTLYWYSDDSTTELTGTGTFKQGETKGFTVASNHGITFIGDLTATVSKPDSSTVRAEIDADRLRIRLHDSDYNAGKSRIKFYDEGYLTLGATEKFSAAYSSKINNLDQRNTPEFENVLKTENFGYNISFGKENTSYFIDRGSDIPFDTSTIVSERSSALVDRNGSFSSIKNRVVLWQ